MKQFKKLLSVVLSLFMIFTTMTPQFMTHIHAAQTYDTSVNTAIKPYDGVPRTPFQITQENYAAFGLNDTNWSPYKGYYGIRNASELYGFADLVRQGYRTINAIILRDIVINEDISSNGPKYEWTPISSLKQSQGYIGVFDGGGHTISGIYFNHNDIGLYGLFAHIGTDGSQSNTQIKNFRIKNAYVKAGTESGMIVGQALGWGNVISNVVVDSDVTIDFNHEYSGGILGSVSVGNPPYGNRVACRITNTVFLGKMRFNGVGFLYSDASALDYIGGISGVSYYKANAYEHVVLENCYFIPSNIVDANGNRKMHNGMDFNYICGGYFESWDRKFAYRLPKMELASVDAPHTCIYLHRIDVANDCTYASTGSFSYCMVCHKIKDGESCTYQAPDKNDHQILGASCINKGTCLSCGYETEKDTNLHVPEEKIVYTINSKDNLKHDASYELCKTLVKTEDHYFGAISNGKCKYCEYICTHPDYVNGSCTICNEAKDSVPLEDEDGYYQLYNAAHLYWYINVVNHDYFYANAKLMNDIVVNKNVIKDGALNDQTELFTDWIVINNGDYEGIFDGNGYSISGLYYNQPDKPYAAFIETNGGTIKNLTIKDSYFRAKDRVGGISAWGDGTIDQCAVINCILKGDRYVGAITGALNYGTIQNSYSQSKVESTSLDAGGITGEMKGNAKIVNCYSNSEITSAKNAGALVGSIVAVSGTITSITNSYYNHQIFSGEPYGYLDTSYDTAKITNVEGKSPEQFKSGEVAYLLNESKDNGIFKQTIGIDDYPNFYESGSLAYDETYGYANMLQDIPLGKTIKTDANGIYIIPKDKTVFVKGTLENIGTIINHGTICIETNGKFIQNGKYDGTGNIEVNGTLENQSEMKISNDMTIKGTLNNKAQLTFAGKVTNDGTIENDVDGMLLFEKEFINYGKVKNNGQLESKISFINYEKFNSTGTLTLSGSAWNKENGIVNQDQSKCSHIFDESCDDTCNFCNYHRNDTIEHRMSEGFCTRCGYAEKPTSINNVYRIASFGNLVWFARKVNGENNFISNTNIDAVLTKNISAPFEVTVSIGNEEYPYRGVFDGNEHAITLHDIIGYQPQPTALFNVVEGAAIKNLIVRGGSGAIVANGNAVGGMIGTVLSGYVTIENCVADINLTMNTKNGYVGGLVGFLKDGALAIENCGYVGTINGATNAIASGLVGYSNENIMITDSFTAAQYTKNFATGSETFVSPIENATIDESYYVNQVGSTQDEAYQIDAADVQSGALAYKFQQNNKNWYQNIDNGKYPRDMLYPYQSMGIVYYSYQDCEAETMTYSNRYGKATKGHELDNEATCHTRAWCHVCNDYVGEEDMNNHVSEETKITYIDGTYHAIVMECCGTEIERIKHIEESNVNGISICKDCGHAYGSADAEQHEGVVEWHYPDKSHHVQRYSCCGLYLSQEEEHTLEYKFNEEEFRIEAVCTKCHAEGSVTIDVTGNRTASKVYDGTPLVNEPYAMGIFGGLDNPIDDYHVTLSGEERIDAGTYKLVFTQGDYRFEKDITIEKRPITITDVGVRYKAYDGTNTLDIYNVNYSGKVIYDEGNYDGEWDDIADDVEVKFNAASAYLEDSIPGDYATAIVENLELSGSDIDNYYIANENFNAIPLKDDIGYDFTLAKGSFGIELFDQNVKGDEPISQDAYRVYGLSNDFTVSGIKLVDEGSTISFNTDEMVILKGDKDVTSYFDKPSTQTAHIQRECANHEFDEQGFCKTGECNKYDVPKYILDKNYHGYYQIENAGQLYWYADCVINFSMADEARLANDIIINPDINANNLREWIPINDFYGTINGNGYTISGLYVNQPDKNYIGLIGQGGYGEIKNLTIANSSFYGKGYVGAIAGQFGGIVLNCSVTDTVNVKATNAENVGGFIGYYDGHDFSNNIGCANVSGTFSVDGEMKIGGLIGTNAGIMKNSFTNYPTAVYTFLSNYGMMEHIYYIGNEDNYESTTAVTTEQMSSGELAYLLQSNVKEVSYFDEETGEEIVEIPEIWGQNIGKDTYPTIFGPKVYRGESCQGTIVYTNIPSTQYHEWEYVLDGDQINYQCKHDSCKESQGSISFIVPEHAVYNGETHSAKIQSTLDNIDGIYLTYWKDDKKCQPIEAGSYTVKMVLADVELVKEFTIDKANVAQIKVTLAESPVYSGTEVTQEIESVMMDKYNMPYEVSSNTVAVAGIHEMILSNPSWNEDIHLTFEVKLDTSKLDALTMENVTYDDYDTIYAIFDMIDNANLENADEETIAAYEEISEKAQALNDKLEEVSEEVNSTKALYKLDDKNDYLELARSIPKLLDNTNVSENQKVELQAILDEVNTYLAALADKNLLLEALNKAEEIIQNQEQYTAESYVEFNNAYIQAQLVYNKLDASQDNVDNATNALNTAILALKLNQTVPNKVKNLVAKDTNYKTITLTWDASKGATAYDVYRKSYDSDEFKLYKSVEKTTLAVSGVMTGKEYAFYVVAKNEAGTAEASKTVTKATTLQGKVTLSMKQVSVSKFKLNWTAIDGATRYIVYRKRNDDSFKKVLTLGAKDLEYTTAEMPNGNYQFIIKAGRYDSKDRVMTNASNTVKGNVEELAPTVTLTAQSKAIKVSWKTMEGVTHYQVYRATSKTGKYTKLVTTTSTSYTVKSLTKGKAYYFKVRGYKTYKSGDTIKYNVYTPYSSVKTTKAK